MASTDVEPVVLQRRIASSVDDAEEGPMPAIGRGEVLDLLKGGLSFEPPTVPGRPPTFLHELVPYLSGSAAVLRTKVGALGGERLVERYASTGLDGGSLSVSFRLASLEVENEPESPTGSGSQRTRKDRQKGQPTWRSLK
jgi:hypothetical protein